MTRRYRPGWILATLAQGARTRTVVECKSEAEARALRATMYKRSRSCTIAVLGRNLVLTPLANPTVKVIGDD